MVQKTVDIGTADNVIQDEDTTAIVYDIDEDSIIIHAKEIAQLEKEGVKIADVKHSITAIEIPPSFKRAHQALTDASATVTYAKDECLIDSKSGKLLMYEGIHSNTSCRILLLSTFSI